MEGNIHKCIDCRKEISRQATRCKSCTNRNRKGTYKNPKLAERNRKNKGKNHPFFGKKRPKHSKRMKELWKGREFRPSFSEETKKKIGIASKNRLKNPKNHPMFGKHHTKESKIKNSKAHKGKVTHGRHEKYKKTWMRSSWEVAYARYCIINHIKYRYENKTFDLGNCTYTPDFHLIEKKLWIEIKGYWRDDAKVKFNAFKKLYPKENIKVLMKPELLKMGVL